MNGYGLYANIVKPPFTTLTSYDLNKGTIKWQVPLGDDPRLASAGVTGTGTAGDFKFGVIPTATGLVFVAGGDDKLHVYDAANGKEIWSAAFGAASRGIPSMYELDGRQYLLMTASDPGVGPNRRPGRTCRTASSRSRCRGRSSGTRATGWLDALLLTGGRWEAEDCPQSHSVLFAPRVAPQAREPPSSLRSSPPLWVLQHLSLLQSPQSRRRIRASTLPQMIVTNCFPSTCT